MSEVSGVAKEEEQMKETPGLQNFMEALAERMKNTKVGDEIEYPIEVSAIKILGRPLRKEMVGSWVSVRPCAPEHEGKTFLGVYLGDLFNGGAGSYNIKTKEVEVVLRSNPAIYTPDLKKIIWGCESWWGRINSPEDLKKISDADIQNVWYVKALHELESGTK